MPRRKTQGIQLQRKFAAKQSSCVQFKKTALDAKPEAGPIRLPMPLLADTADTTDSANTNYLHKKFKKGTGVSSTPKTESNLPNGTSDNLKPTNGLLPHLEVWPNGLVHSAGAPTPNGARPLDEAEEESLPAQPGRYVCPFCQMVCAKPSVLQKHLRAHTNERPYPCASCGFAFKTKSNLYKHCRSQAHRAKTAMGGTWESNESAESDMSDESSEQDCNKSKDSQPRIYKPKFHKAAFYQDDMSSAMSGEMSPRSKFPAPSTEQLEERISKIIRDNQVIFDTMEPQFSKKFLLRQNSREKESSSPKSEVEVRRNNETKSKLALALMKVDRNERSYSPSYPSVNSENNTYQPLNLTMKTLASPPVETSQSPEIHQPTAIRYQSDPDNDIGPLLGSTPLIEASSAKKRRVQSTTVPPDPRELAAFASRRLSTSSLPSTLKSLEELSKHPMKQPCMNMFGGEVKIMDSGEARTVRISAVPDVRMSEDSRVMTVAKNGLLASGGTLVSPGGPAFHIANILGADVSGLTLAPNVVTPNLAVPGVPQPESSVGVLTIMHGEKAIPFVPGMPGPQSLLPDPPRRPKHCVSSLTNKASSSVLKINLPNEVPKIEISSPPVEEKPAVQKFLRPTSLPLKPGSFTPKRLHQGTTPTVLSLVSPETPRQKKSYGQLFLNGHAYTYLGMKCSTRSYYCTISRPQPMYVERSSQLPRLSMYSNWKVYSEADTLGMTPGQAMAQYDSRYKTGGFTTADSRKGYGNSSTVTHSSSWSLKSEPKAMSSDGEPEKKRMRVCNGGYESGEQYTYVRGRGRGRYVCEECGIRCKKPSMLKKHIRTHTDVRPYSCKHCSFAFKTKGNLTKHMKSKSHFKRCNELGVDPTPPVLSDTESDRPEESGTSDDDSDEDDDDESNGTEALEREAACSLLSLSATPLVSQYVAAGLLPRAVHDSGPVCYPYTSVSHKNVQVQTEVHPPYRERPDSPMDLSQKEPSDFLSKDSQFLLPVSTPPETSVPREVERPVPVPAYLAASIANIQQQHQVVDPPGGHMLQAYLTAKALRDVQIKQQHRSRSPEVSSDGNTPAPIPSTLTPSPMRLLEPPGVSAIMVPEPTERILVVGDLSDGGKRVIVSIPSNFHSAPSSDQRAPAALSKPNDANLKAEFFPPASGPNHSYVSVTEDGRSICVICNKTFNKPSQLRLHVNIHYFERPFRCEACAVSFRTKGHLQKHERSSSHHNKVSMNTTFGAATTTNPRPFKCDDCKIAFRIHGHLAKHLRSKMHIMKLECLGKLPFGTYADLERSGYNLNEIDTTDCDISLESLLALSKKLDSSNAGFVQTPRMDDADSDGSSSEGLHTEHIQCGVCGEVSDSSAALQVHMFAEHGKDAVLDKRKLDD